MSISKNVKKVAVSLFAAGLSFSAYSAVGAEQVPEPLLTAVMQEQDKEAYAADELSSGDWSKAEAALLKSDVAKEDEVFAKLNLAFVYSTTGRRDMAVAIYNEIISSKKNPYALTVSGQPRRVKSIAKLALARLNTTN